MTRAFLIEHLISEGCYTESNNDIGEFWINCVNGSTCHIPYRENLQLTTYCHIIYELKIIPPAKYESDYEVYLHFRTDQLEKFIKK
jgi:hypothetical protein